MDAHARDIVLMLIREDVTDKVIRMLLLHCGDRSFLLRYCTAVILKCFTYLLPHGESLSSETASTHCTEYFSIS